MMDREIVIKGLEYAWEYIRERPNPTATPKAMAMDGIKKAIALLKEQEPVEPIKPIDVDDSFTYLCSNCKGELFCGDRIRDKYCPTCGRVVNWKKTLNG